MSESQPLVRVENLSVRFSVTVNGKKRHIIPVDAVSFEIGLGEVLALVGESGSGKTTIGRTLVRVIEPVSGRIEVNGRDVTHIRGRDLAAHQKTVQMVFQDPFGSLNPVRTVEHHLALPLRLRERSNQPVRDRVDRLLERVGLTPVAETRVKFPHELSGGQRQRVAIARALAVRPQFLVADEPISMLDVSVRAGILTLMNQLKADFNLSYLYITHDLASARYFGDRIMVMYGGRVVEVAPSPELIRQPIHPYTRLLLAATPGNGPREPVAIAENQGPNLLQGRLGCPFRDRCNIATGVCQEVAPRFEAVDSAHSVACHHGS